ncbi:hypothetical protein [Shewanella algae]|uniref:hypothetical protein n=1 Tax=Shewanella algae TaxID=38313 RepID=UPI0011822C96|nr:hypothetical protein [Shewanella algae]MBO2646361.1 hypothetical protein [Shewanella algae]TVO81221.1 hypothetical protein AYI78_17355 [Shewanella algae]TVO81284.1 hypothetical protein AYI76_17210 [Shewanella algae]TVO92056.1 hypothetical protein AYI79_17275 [Shewanella algae]
MSAIEIARETFERIKAANPHLKMEIEESPEYVDLAMKIKKQTGLDFDVYLNLQNDDELHLQFDPFWGEWFPCTESARVSEYEAAVNGVLSGAYRTKIINRRGSPVKALLQAPSVNEWSTVFTWGKLHLPLGAKTISYVQNQPNT